MLLAHTSVATTKTAAVRKASQRDMVRCEQRSNVQKTAAVRKASQRETCVRCEQRSDVQMDETAGEEDENKGDSARDVC